MAEILFIDRVVPEIEPPMLDVVHAERPDRPSVDEVRAMFDGMTGRHWLQAELIHGAGPWLSECRRNRIKDRDHDRCQILVREGFSVPGLFMESRPTNDFTRR